MTDAGQDPHSRAAAAVNTGQPVEAQYVRQGLRGTRVLWILVIGLALAALATFGMWATKSDELQAANVNSGKQAADAQVFSQDEPSAKQTDAPNHPAPQSGETSGSGTAPQQ